MSHKIQKKARIKKNLNSFDKEEESDSSSDDENNQKKEDIRKKYEKKEEDKKLQKEVTDITKKNKFKLQSTDFRGIADQLSPIYYNEPPDGEHFLFSYPIQKVSLKSEINLKEVLDYLKKYKNNYSNFSIDLFFIRWSFMQYF